MATTNYAEGKRNDRYGLEGYMNDKEHEAEEEAVDIEVIDEIDKFDKIDEFVARTPKEIVRQVQRELCLIKLCWPQIPTEDSYTRLLPDTYRCVSDKERLVLWYAENFRRQFHAKYSDRRPLLLACENECGIQVSEISLKRKKRLVSISNLRPHAFPKQFSTSLLSCFSEFFFFFFFRNDRTIELDGNFLRYRKSARNLAITDSSR